MGVGALHLLFSIVSFGLWQLIFSFLYNKQYMTRMLTKGWVLAGSESQNITGAEHLGMAAPGEIGLVEFIDRIDKNTAE